MLFRVGGLGRLGNQVIPDLCMYYIAKKYNQVCQFYNVETLNRLGFPSKNESDNRSLPVVDATDEYVHKLLKGEAELASHVAFKFLYCQTTEIARCLIEYMPEFEFDVNDNVFMHVRLGDVSHLNNTPRLNYYEKVLSQIQYTGKLYVTSDSPEHEVCKTLVNKYGAEPFNEDEVTTWLFGRTCRHVVMSLGTFSWILGLFATKSHRWYPNPKDYNIWHGPIFEATDWNMVTNNTLPQ